MTPSDKRLERIEERLRLATDGPWKYDKATGYIVGSSLPTQKQGRYASLAQFWDREEADFPNCKNNATFMALAREDIPWLIGVVKDLRAQIARHDQARERPTTTGELAGLNLRTINAFKRRGVTTRQQVVIGIANNPSMWNWSFRGIGPHQKAAVESWVQETAGS